MATMTKNYILWWAIRSGQVLARPFRYLGVEAPILSGQCFEDRFDEMSGAAFPRRYK